MNQVQNEFLRMAVPAAMATQKAYGVLASVTVAQAILESGWGQSQLARRCFNYFGIKATHGQVAAHEYAEFPTKEYATGRSVQELAQFAKYSSPADGFQAHARLLAQSARYQPAMAAACRGAEAFAAGLQNCGYSTLEDADGKPIYAERLMQFVREYNLEQYDVPPEPAAQANAA